jgi:hypothetical protein
VALALLGGMRLRLSYAALAGVVVWTLWVGYVVAVSAM